jgi:molybdenum cofactor biosynthesis enzyme MoaA
VTTTVRAATTGYDVAKMMYEALKDAGYQDISVRVETVEAQQTVIIEDKEPYE